MKRAAFLPLFLCLCLFCALPAGAVVNITTSGTTRNTAPPANAQVSNWNTGWDNTEGITGWDYVGNVNGASGVYLGNGWVITAAHVNLGSTYVLDGVSYDINLASAILVGNADLRMFQIDTDILSLPTLTLSLTAPTFQEPVVMIGYGGGTKGWGQALALVTGTNIIVNGRDTTYFYTLTDATHHAAAIDGDSGGAGFVYRNGEWELAGIIGLSGTTTTLPTEYAAYMAQMSEYQATIETIRAIPIPVPEPSALALLPVGLGLGWWVSRRRARRA